MIFKKTIRNFKHLRQESEEVRMRAAIRITVLLAITIIPLSLLAFLPLQLAIQRGRNQKEPQSAISQVRQPANVQTNINIPQVGGVSDINKQNSLISDYINSNLQPSQTPEIKPLDTNNIPVEITP